MLYALPVRDTTVTRFIILIVKCQRITNSITVITGNLKLMVYHAKLKDIRGMMIVHISLCRSGEKCGAVYLEIRLVAT